MSDETIDRRLTINLGVHEKGNDIMKAMTQTVSTAEPAHWKSTTVKTTLCELIEAINEELQPGEEHLVSTIVLHLLDTGNIKFLGDPEEIKRVVEESTVVEKNECYPEMVTELFDKSPTKGNCHLTFGTESFLSSSLACP